MSLNEAIIYSLSFSLQLIIYILSIVGAFLIGRHYGIIKRTKLDKPHTSEDIVSDIKEATITRPPRIISPSKRAASDMKDLEKDII